MKVLGRETPNEAWYRELGKVMSRTSHPRTSVALSIRQRDLMIYQQVRRIDELERRISELQLELKQCEGQQGRTGSVQTGYSGRPAQPVRSDRPN